MACDGCSCICYGVGANVNKLDGRYGRVPGLQVQATYYACCRALIIYQESRFVCGVSLPPTAIIT